MKYPKVPQSAPKCHKVTQTHPRMIGIDMANKIMLAMVFVITFYKTTDVILKFSKVSQSASKSAPKSPKVPKGTHPRMI